MNDRMVFYNGNFHTMDPGARKVEALSMEKGRIIHIGTNLEVRRSCSPGWKSMDLQGKTVLPGFIDTHVHLMSTSMTTVGIDLGETRNTEEILARVEERAKQTPPGQWILGYFITYLPDRSMPTRFDLDRVSSNHPVRVTHRNGHLCSLNTLAIEHLNVRRDLEGVEYRSGDMTGVIRDPAIQALPHPGRSMSEEERLRTLNLASQRILAKGVTTLHALDGGPRYPEAIPFLLKVREALPIKIVPYNQTRMVQEAVDLGLPRIGGCICADGAFESHTAALFEPYADEPDHYGTLTFTQEEMSGFILKAHQEGLQVAIHCEADRAIEQVLYAYERALSRFPRGNHRHRIEHFELPTENQIERMARNGILAAMQPSFLPAFFFRGGGERYESFLGRSRLRRIHPYRTMLDQGVLMAGGSDSPVTPIDPLSGIEAAVNHLHAEERLTVPEAIQLFTVNAARFAFEEDEKGSLEPGKAADLVVLDGDPCSVDLEKIHALPIEMTVVDGRVRFRRENSTLTGKEGWPF